MQDHQDHTTHASPFHTVPGVVVAMAGAIFAIECLFSGAAAGLWGGPGGVGWRLAAIRSYGFFEPLFVFAVRHGVGVPDQAMRLVAYPFVHASFTHTVFACVFVLAFGNAVVRCFGPVRFLAIFWGASICGALCHAVLLETPAPLIGAFPGAYALVGAFTFQMWQQARRAGRSQMRAFALIAALAVAQVVVLPFAGSAGLGSSWLAELAGAAFGFAVCLVLIPGGWTRLRVWLQRG